MIFTNQMNNPSAYIHIDQVQNIQLYPTAVPSGTILYPFAKVIKKLIKDGLLGQIWLILNSSVNQKETASDATKGGENK